MTSGAARQVFKFGVFEADGSAGELRKHGIRVKLHAQPFQVLLMLLERPSEVLTREELRQRLWGDDTFVDFDHGLNSAVNKIRDALNDSAAQPRYVETVSGRGYRFIAPVSQAAPATVPDPPATPKVQPVSEVAPEPAPASVLSPPAELPAPSHKVVRILLILVQALYLSFYLVALANLREVDDLLLSAPLLPPSV